MNSQVESAHSEYRDQEIGIKFRAQFKSGFFRFWDTNEQTNMSNVCVISSFWIIKKKDILLFPKIIIFLGFKKNILNYQ